MLYVLLRAAVCEVEEKACDSPKAASANALLQVTRNKVTVNASVATHSKDEEAPPAASQALFRRESEGGAVYIGVGETASFDDQGFFNVAATCCRLEMLVFMRRTLEEMGYEVCVEAAMASMVPQFTCDTATENPTNKTFAILKDRLLQSSPPAKCAAVAPTGTCFSSGARMAIEPGHDEMLEECKASGKYDFNALNYARHCRDARGNSPPSVAKELLPHDLYFLGLGTFGGEENLNEIILQAHHMKVNYAGQEIQLRIRQGDDALLRYGLPGEDGRDYGLPIEGEEKVSLLQGSDGVLNMIDLGGNYGVVTIALFKALKGKVRTVSVEAMPSTYFFLRWNMWINGVPLLTTSNVKAPTALGVAAINAAVTGNSAVFMQMCASPSNSMNSAKNNGGCPKEHQVTVEGVSVDTIFSLFGQESIALVKMDCEGCEEQAAPDLVKYASRVRRVVGELHAPTENVIDSVCKFNAEPYFTKICKVSRGSNVAWEAIGLACKDGTRPKCNW